MFGFFPNPESLPRKSLRYVQIGASTSLLNCLLYNVYIHFTLKKKKKGRKNANSDFLTALQIFHGTVEL